MKITFQTEAARQAAKQQTEEQHRLKGNGSMAPGGVYSACAGFVQSDRMIAGEGKKSMLELQTEAAAQDVSVQRNYKTVMSHTMSEEDFAKMEEEGFHFEYLDPETAVTIVDKIKAELARSGQNIAGYTDTLDMDTLAAAVGSTALAQSISESFRQADVPLTPENLEGIRQAWEMAGQLLPPTEGAEGYLVDNQLEPEIWNLYLAQSSGAQTASGRLPRYYAEDIQGYYALSASEQTETVSQGAESQGKLLEQIDRVIEEAGLTVDENSRSMGELLLNRGIPLTPEHLKQLSDLQGLKLPPGEEAFARAAANAVLEGKSPVNANLLSQESIYQKAERVLQYYKSEEALISRNGLAARRQLEEIRLYMTAEVNVKLIKSGFAIDTAPMEELVEALKKAEEQLAGQYFPGDGEAVSKYQTYRSTNQLLEELSGLPARVLGTKCAEGTLQEFHKEGSLLRQDYERARESYEPLMTAPRSDLGDNIRKAFANVDEILADMGLEPVAENRRAVRILGYNSMDITLNSIEQVREADTRIQKLMKRMTPAATLKMIREGVNPLEKTLPELEQYFEELPEEYKESAQSYSRFLYGLEKNGEISENERETYIGIYRLLRQIEKSDGAVVGALINSRAELHLNNLLSAVRSRKFRHLDVKVSDRLGAAVEKITRGESISGQIEKAFAKDLENVLTEASYSREAESAYRQEALSQLRQTAELVSDEECMMLLQRSGFQASAENLLAAGALLRENKVRLKWPGFSALSPADAENRTSAENEEIEGYMTEVSECMRRTASLWQGLEEEGFSRNYAEMLQETARAAETASLEAAASMDVRQLSLMNKQLSLMTGLAAREEYFLPVYIGGSLTGIRLTLEKGDGEEGRAHVTLKNGERTEAEADFSLKDGKLTAAFVQNEESEVIKLEKTADTFTEQASKYWVVERVSVFCKGSPAKPLETAKKEQALSGESVPSKSPKTDSRELYRIAKIFIEAARQ